MRKTGHVALLAALGVMAMVRPARSDSPVRTIWRGTGGWGNNSAYCSLYDPKNIETLHGMVLSIENVTPLPGMSPGVELQLQTAKETIPVHLGPEWYLENQDIDINSQDKVVVKGSRLVCNGQRVLVAAEIRKGDQVIRLRDAKGLPLWSATTPH
jgi:hypothetical protein